MGLLACADFPCFFNLRVGEAVGIGCGHASILILHVAYRVIPLQDLRQAWSGPADDPSAFGLKERQQVGTESIRMRSVG